MIEGLNELSKSLQTSKEKLEVDTSKELDLSEDETSSSDFIDYSKEMDLSEDDYNPKDIIDYSKEMDLSEDEDNDRYDYRKSYTPVDSERGRWEDGERGEGIYVPLGNTPMGEKVKYELNRHGLKGIKYTNASPDFGPISEICVKIPNMSSERKGDGNNFDQANIITARKWNEIAFEEKTDWTKDDVNYWKNANKYTWHEDSDMETMYLVPTEIHEFFDHAGGVAECRIKEKIDSLDTLTEKLKSHLEQAGIKDAIIYEPHNPEEYWNPNNTRIAFCNEEPYSTDDNYKKGINILDSDTLDAWSDGNKTIKTEFDLNYLIRHALQTGKEISTEDLTQLKNEIKPNGSEYFNKYGEMDKSLYFNYRYSIPTDTRREHTCYIQEQYKNDPFYAQHYKAFLETTNPEILVIGSKFGTELYTQIYPEMQGKLTYKGEPIIHNGRLVISIPHPSIISKESIADVVNKIVRNYDNIDKSKILGNPSAEFNPNKYIEKEDILIAGVEKGREMTFTEADSGNVNPNFEECDGFQCNCQSCVVVFEARLRGYDIEAKPFEMSSNAFELSENTSLAWLTPEGEHPKYIMNFEANSVGAAYQFISDTVKSGERYTLEGVWKGGFGCGHIISVFREETGNLVFYDPQVNMTYNEKSIKENFLNYMQKGNTEDTAIKLLRVDNLDIDTDFVSSIVRRSQNYA